ncbi:MAG: hypothetical protein FWG85_05820 [Bacteroidetes bacterium]|nr:hypothetical protein [Bacteroidota bacterium]
MIVRGIGIRDIAGTISSFFHKKSESDTKLSVNFTPFSASVLSNFYII